METGLILGAVGVGLTAVFGVVSLYLNRTSRPFTKGSRFTLDGVDHPALQMKFDGEPINNLHSIRYVLWNGGRKPIRREDLPSGKAAPAVTLSDNAKILSVRSRASNHGDSSHTVKVNRIEFSFEYLNHRDGYQCEILCSTDDGLAPGIDTTGDIKGARVRSGEWIKPSTVDAGTGYVVSLFILLSIISLLPLVGAIVVGQYAWEFWLTQNLLLAIPLSLSTMGLMVFGIWLIKEVFKSLGRLIPQEHATFLKSPDFEED